MDNPGEAGAETAGQTPPGKRCRTVSSRRAQPSPLIRNLVQSAEQKQLDSFRKAQSQVEVIACPTATCGHSSMGVQLSRRRQ